MRRLFVALLAIAVLFAVWRTVRSDLPEAEQGRRIAEKSGCFACHGPDGIRGAYNPGRLDRKVPTFEGDVMMYAKTEDEIRQWIEDGSTEKRRQSQTWRAERQKGALRMPGFEKRLSKRQIDRLVAYVEVMAGPEIPDSLAKHGYERSEALGCVGCHGPGGRLARRNPGSLKGYVPSWDGQDFAELVRDSTEFRQWVDHGVSDRFAKNPMAGYFLRRAVLHMPHFEKQREPDDIAALWAYVRWLRKE
jgi:mono/diheme cytochrome c family protein